MSRKIEKLSDKIAAVLRARGWEQKDLAKYLNVNESQISRWIAGESTPRWKHSFKIELLYEDSA